MYVRGGGIMGCLFKGMFSVLVVFPGRADFLDEFVNASKFGVG